MFLGHAELSKATGALQLRGALSLHQAPKPARSTCQTSEKLEPQARSLLASKEGEAWHSPRSSLTGRDNAFAAIEAAELCRALSERS